MDWVKVIPAWVWLLLAAILGYRLVLLFSMGMVSMSPLTFLRILAVAFFIGLAFCRLRWWRSLRIVQAPNVTLN